MNHTPFLLDIAEKEFFYAVLYGSVLLVRTLLVK